MSFEGRAGTAAFLRRKIGGLELLNQPAAVAVRHAAVEPSGDDGSPILHRLARLQMHFPAIVRLGRATVFQDAGVQLRAQAQAMPAFTALEPDSGKAVVLRQFPDRNLEHLRCRIKFQTVRH